MFKILTNLLPQKITILQVIICDELRKGSMLNSGNNDREQNWLLLSPRVREASPTVTFGCPRWLICNVWQMYYNVPSKYVRYCLMQYLNHSRTAVYFAMDLVKLFCIWGGSGCWVGNKGVFWGAQRFCKKTEHFEGGFVMFRVISGHYLPTWPHKSEVSVGYNKKIEKSKIPCHGQDQRRHSPMTRS
jgi:hypothetical protein